MCRSFGMEIIPFNDTRTSGFRCSSILQLIEYLPSQILFRAEARSNHLRGRYYARLGVHYGKIWCGSSLINNFSELQILRKHCDQTRLRLYCSLDTINKLSYVIILLQLFISSTIFLRRFCFPTSRSDR